MSRWDVILMVMLQLYRPQRQKRTVGHVRPAYSEDSDQPAQSDQKSSLDAFWIAKDAKFIHADNKDSDQTARMRRLI